MPRDMAAPSTASSTKDEQRVSHPSRLEQDEEPGPDLSVLKEIGRKALIDSLNSVRSTCAQTEGEADFRGFSIEGQWCKNSGA